MSRCFPYPPPGYLRNGASGEALIVSIKREREKAKTEQRKEKRKEKKEKTREKATKIKEKEICHGADNGTLNKPCDETSQRDGKGKVEFCHFKTRGNEDEPLEKSDITEEHGHAVGCHSLSNSSDSTDSSKKRKRETSNHVENRGKIIRIRLPLQKHREENELRSQEQQCYTSGTTDTVIQQKREVHAPDNKHNCTTNSKRIISNVQIAHRPNEELRSLDLEKNSEFRQSVNGTASGTMLKEKNIPKPVSLYDALIRDWVPQSLQLEQSDDDEKWLFDIKKQEIQGSKRYKDCNEVPSPTVYPQAHYLAEADVYALPYSIPF